MQQAKGRVLPGCGRVSDNMHYLIRAPPQQHITPHTHTVHFTLISKMCSPILHIYINQTYISAVPCAVHV